MYSKTMYTEPRLRLWSDAGLVTISMRRMRLGWFWMSLRILISQGRDGNCAGEERFVSFFWGWGWGGVSGVGRVNTGTKSIVLKALRRRGGGARTRAPALSFRGVGDDGRRLRRSRVGRDRLGRRGRGTAPDRTERVQRHAGTRRRASSACIERIERASSRASASMSRARASSESSACIESSVRTRTLLVLHANLLHRDDAARSTVDGLEHLSVGALADLSSLWQPASRSFHTGSSAARAPAEALPSRLRARFLSPFALVSAAGPLPAAAPRPTASAGRDRFASDADAESCCAAAARHAAARARRRRGRVHRGHRAGRRTHRRRRRHEHGRRRRRRCDAIRGCSASKRGLISCGACSLPTACPTTPWTTPRPAGGGGGCVCLPGRPGLRHRAGRVGAAGRPKKRGAEVSTRWRRGGGGASARFRGKGGGWGGEGGEGGEGGGEGRRKGGGRGGGGGEREGYRRG